MTKQRLEPGAAASLALNTLLSQVTALVAMSSGALRLQLESLEQIIRSNIAMIEEASDGQVDDYNELSDELTRAYQDLDTKQASIINLRESVQNLKAELEAISQQHQAALQAEQSARLDAEGKTARTETKLVAANAENQRIAKDLKDLKALDPAGMKKRLTAKQKELDSAKGAQVELRSQNMKLKTKSVSDDPEDRRAVQDHRSSPGQHRHA